MRQQEGPRVLGPYLNRKGGKISYRIIEINSGSRQAHIFPTMDAAKKALAKFTRRLAAQDEKNLEMLIDEFHAYMLIDRGCQPESCGHRRKRLRWFFPSLDVRLSTITAQRSEEIYRWNTVKRCERTGQPYSVATHQSDLCLARAFMNWAISRHYINANPFAQVRMVGQKKAGKPQLRIDEANRWIDAAVGMVNEGNAGALAALLCLWCGFRASEVLKRVVRDVDQGGAIIWVDRGKTKSSRRRPKVPELLRPYLVKLCAGRQPTALVFGERAGGGPHEHAYLYKIVVTICKKAGVPKVCTHSLRGLHATLSLTGGASSDYVATALGHTSFTMTERHYVDPDALASTRSDQVHGALGAHRHQSSAEALFQSLDPATLRELLRLAACQATELESNLDGGNRSAAIPPAP